MDMNVYILERLVEERLIAARAASAREALLASVRLQRPDLRALIGLRLIRAGRWLRRRAIQRRAPVGTQA